MLIYNHLNAWHDTEWWAQFSSCENNRRCGCFQRICQICARIDNDSPMLMCNRCGRTYHPHCSHPKMDRIPDGEWFCPHCTPRVLGTARCFMCYKHADDLWDCSKCIRFFHAECVLESPGECTIRWICPICSPDQDQYDLMMDFKRRGISPFAKTTTPKGWSGGDRNSMPIPNGSGNVASSATDFGGNQLLKKRPNRLEELLNAIMMDLESHKDAWPFLNPVDIRAFPTYGKVIKQPMDLGSIKKKLKGHRYKSEDEFVADVELIFSNCHQFNEDGSRVGKAAQSLRHFFKRRWKELKGLQD